MNEQDKKAQRRRVTAADVARLSGVSRATVSYVLNNAPGQTIPEETKARVRAAAVELAYVPSAAAASLRRGHSRIVVLVTDSALTGYVTEPFLRAISDRLTEDDLVPVAHQYASDEALHALLDEIRPFGVIDLTGLSEDVLSRIRTAGVPRLYSSAQGDPAFPRPWENDIGRLQADHLISLGCRTITYIAPAAEHPRALLARARFDGVLRACAAAALAPARYIEVDTDSDTAATALRPLASLDAPGFCAFDDEVAAIALATLPHVGLMVPANAQLIGVDDAPFSGYLSPPLTTISIDSAGSGRQVAARLLGTEPQRSPREAPDARIIERASTAGQS
ncbi:LacI family DNA-binding transcriptional regulator [Microbacterium sp. G2-8]|uniref:LacI family DNA-binding transcriptional regulator n=1 Tax=Microbacterium sp. G2-8 TaxID=2842454 RepID=UPI001C89FC0C|nr:LacI family DNA-binding transcriptional regulator [Microbacterium sp. G2-8]